MNHFEYISKSKYMPVNWAFWTVDLDLFSIISLFSSNPFAIIHAAIWSASIAFGLFLAVPPPVTAT